MNPTKNSTYSQSSERIPPKTTKATIRHPIPSTGEVQSRCFSCEAYDECLELACGFDRGMRHWLRGFDCSRCPSAATLEDVDTSLQRTGGRDPISAAVFIEIVKVATRTDAKSATEIAKITGQSHTNTIQRLRGLEISGMVVREERFLAGGGSVWTHHANVW